MAAAPGPIMETRGKFDHTVLIKESNVKQNHGCIYVNSNMLIKRYINSRLTCLLTYLRTSIWSILSTSKNQQNRPSQSRFCRQCLRDCTVGIAGGGLGVQPPTHVHRRSFLVENRL